MTAFQRPKGIGKLKTNTGGADQPAARTSGKGSWYRWVKNMPGPATKSLREAADRFEVTKPKRASEYRPGLGTPGACSTSSRPVAPDAANTPDRPPGASPCSSRHSLAGHAEGRSTELRSIDGSWVAGVLTQLDVRVLRRARKHSWPLPEIIGAIALAYEQSPGSLSSTQGLVEREEAITEGPLLGVEQLASDVGQWIESAWGDNWRQLRRTDALSKERRAELMPARKLGIGRIADSDWCRLAAAVARYSWSGPRTGDSDVPRRRVLVSGPGGPYTMPQAAGICGGVALTLSLGNYVGEYGFIGGAALTVGGVAVARVAAARRRVRRVSEEAAQGAGREELLERWRQDLTERARAHQTSRLAREAAVAGSAGGDSRDLERVWVQANAIRSEVLDAYAEFELDAAEVLLRRPLLADVTEPATAHWLEALEAMNSAFPEDAPSSVAVARTCLGAAENARAAWKVADKRARDVGLGHLSEADGRRLDQVNKLLSSARDRGTTDAERRSQLMKIVEILVAVTGQSKKTVTGNVQRAINAHLLSIGAPALQLAIEQ